MNSEEEYSKFLHVMPGLRKWMNPILLAYRSVWRFEWERHTHRDKQTCVKISTHIDMHRYTQRDTHRNAFIHRDTYTHVYTHVHTQGNMNTVTS